MWGAHAGGGEVLGCRGADLSPMKRVLLTLRMRWMLRRWVPPTSGPPRRAVPWPTNTG